MGEKIPWKCPYCRKTRLLPAGYSAAACIDCCKRIVKSAPQKAVSRRDELPNANSTINPEAASTTPIVAGQRSVRRLTFAILVLAPLLACTVWLGFFAEIKSGAAKHGGQPAPQIAEIKTVIRQYLSETLNDPEFQEVKWSEPVPQLSLQAGNALKTAQLTLAEDDGNLEKEDRDAAQAIIDDAPRRKALTTSIRLRYRQKGFGGWVLSDDVFTVHSGKVIDSLSMKMFSLTKNIDIYDPRRHFDREDAEERGEPVEIPAPLAPVPPADLRRIFR